MYHIPYPNKFPTLLCHVHHASRIAPPLPLPLSFSVVISLHSLSLQAQLHQILHQALLYAVYPGPLGSASILLGPCSSTPQCSQPANRPRSLFNLSINIKYDTVGSVDLILQKVSGAERYRLKLSQFMSLNYYNMQRVNNMWSWAAMCFCWSDMRNCHVFKTFTAIVMVLSSYQVRHFV